MDNPMELNADRCRFPVRGGSLGLHGFGRRFEPTEDMGGQSAHTSWDVTDADMNAGQCRRLKNRTRHQGQEQTVVLRSQATKRGYVLSTLMHRPALTWDR